MSTVSDKALSAHLETRFSKFERTDKRIAREVEAQKQTASGILKVGRSLFPGCDQPLKNVLASIEYARTVHERNSLPWPPSRAVTIEHFTKHRDRVTAAINQFDVQLQTFINEYDTLVAQGIRNSNGLNDPDEYMPKDEITTRFQIRLQYGQLTDAQDWFSTPLLDSTIQQELASKTIQANADMLAGAVNAVRDQLCNYLIAARDNLKKTQERNPDQRFNTSWLVRLQEFVSIWPGLNLAKDPLVDEMILALSPITRHSVETMKTSKTAQTQSFTDLTHFIEKYSDWLNEGSE